MVKRCVGISLFHCFTFSPFHCSTSLLAPPEYQRGGVAEFLPVIDELFCRENDIADPPVDQLFSLSDEFQEKFAVNFITDKNQVDDLVINPPCEIPGHVNFLNISQFGDDTVDDLVKPDGFEQDVVDVVKQRMTGVGTEDFLIPFHFRFQQSCQLKLVQFETDSVSGFTEFQFQVA